MTVKSSLYRLLKHCDCRKRIIKVIATKQAAEGCEKALDAFDLRLAEVKRVRAGASGCGTLPDSPKLAITFDVRAITIGAPAVGVDNAYDTCKCTSDDGETDVGHYCHVILVMG